ncbi:MAG TPA: hypothetical protein VLX30_04280 [Burkholderiales bacterium]|nr:hypothetical protein [Burkholderiales bacterium]
MNLAKLTRVIALCLLAGLAPSARAQMRTIPPDAQRGEIRHVQGMLVEINGQPIMLAPGAEIRDTSNRIILPSAVPPGAPIRYLLDAQGMPFRIWLLSRKEGARRGPNY